MSSYHVTLESSAAKQLMRFDRPTIIRIRNAYTALAGDPRPVGCTKLAGMANAYRIRVGDYRIVYVIEDTIRLVTVTRIGHRRDIYRRL